MNDIYESLYKIFVVRARNGFSSVTRVGLKLEELSYRI